MDFTTITVLILSFVAALFIALFQYVIKVKDRGPKQWVLAFLRSMTLFCVALLIINPKFEQVSYSNEKPKLVVAVDNSASMRHLNLQTEVSQVLGEIRKDAQLNSKFDIEYFKFGNNFTRLDSLGFDDNKTDFSSLINGYDDIFEESIAPLLVLSDGNQTFGTDVRFSLLNGNKSIYPIVLGDTTSYEDLAVSRVNHNRYVYHKNKFEIEILVNYSGKLSQSAQLKISNGNSVVFSQNLDFSSTNASEIITAVLTANTLGIQNYSVELAPLSNEKNEANNSKEFAIEVIDQKTKVAIVYNRPHPDIGALKKAITTNDQREVSLLSPKDFSSRMNEFQLVVLYQPDISFNAILEPLFEGTFNTWVISGPTTDWDLLNDSQNLYDQEITYQEELYQPYLNTAFGPFIISDTQLEDFPPLRSEFGTISFNSSVETAIYKSVNGNPTGFPMLSTMELNEEKHGVLLGEGLWRWRAQSYLEFGSFENFDTFIGKLVQYLSSNKRRQRLIVDYESFYNSSDEILIKAQFFNESYEIDNTANLSISIKNSETDNIRELPLLYAEDGYQVDLSGLESGTYEFNVSNKKDRISQTGVFTVIAFNIEQQYLRSNYSYLSAMATNQLGLTYDSNTINELISNLNEDGNFVTIQKEVRETKALIDWYYLLALIALAVSLEWFIRKYNGLI